MDFFGKNYLLFKGLEVPMEIFLFFEWSYYIVKA